MPELLKTGMDYLHDTLAAQNSVTVTYRRVADTVDVAAVIGRTLFENDDEIAVIEKERSRDFIIIKAVLILSGSTIEPQRGDQIDETRGSTVYTYEVLSDNGAPAFRDSDDYDKAFRIHTKLVAEV